MKRTLSLILAALSLASVLASAACSNSAPADDTTDTAADTTAPVETTTAEPETTADPLADNLPDDVSYDGYNFRIGAAVSDDDWIKYIIRFEETGEVLNDTIYQANMEVAERFGITFSRIPFTGTNYGSMTEVIANAQAGDDVYDLLTMHDARSSTPLLRGMFRNVHELEHVDFEKPWWPKYTMNALTVNDRIYSICSSMSYFSLSFTRCLFFNKGLMRSLNIPFPYDDVRAGTWYLDDLISMTKDIYSDLDMDGTQSIGDRYGFAITNTAYCFLECFGVDVYGRDDQGMITDVFMTERNVELVERTNAWFFGGTKGAYFRPTHGGYFAKDSALTMFAGGNVLFGFNSMDRQVTACMESDVEYGILPMPKLDENQKEYISGTGVNPICIPVTNENMDRTGMIVEAMSAVGYKKVQPAYTETVMKDRYSTDRDSVEMLDIIFAGQMVAGGYLYADGKYRFQTIHDTMWKEASSNINVASYYESTKSAAQKRIDELNAFFFRTEE